ncbi:MAG: protein kinase [Polyangiales bacterium]
MKTSDDPALDATFDAPRDATPDAAPTALAPGRLIGDRYEILRPLGAGAMGAVYEARHRAVERRVALKVLHPGFSHDPSTLHRFMTEARAAGRARHRNIVEVLDFGADGATHWMALELLEGETLEALMTREAPMEPAEVVSILDPLLRAVAHAHSLGLIHRDLKPGNLFLAKEPGTVGVVPKVLDFGIAKNTASSARLTATETLVGTPAYMAPEQIESSRDVTPAADQYAMGCVAYEMLSGRLPIEGDSLPGLLVNKVTGVAGPLDVARPGLSAELVSCVMRSLSRDPAARFPDVEAFRVELLASAATPSSSRPPAPTRSPAPSVTKTSAEPAPKVETAPTVSTPSSVLPAPSVESPIAPVAVARPGTTARVAVAAALVGLALAAIATVVSRNGAAPAATPPETRVTAPLSLPLRDAAPPPDDGPAQDSAPPAAITRAAPDAAPSRLEAPPQPWRHARHPNGRDPQGHRLSIDPTNPL